MYASRFVWGAALPRLGVACCARHARLATRRWRGYVADAPYADAGAAMSLRSIRRRQSRSGGVPPIGNSEYTMFKYIPSIIAIACITACPGCMKSAPDKHITNTDEAAVESDVAQTDTEKAAVPERQLRLMQFSLILLNAKYVEPDRINWRKMTVHAIDALQSSIPELVAKFDRRIDDDPTEVTVRIGLHSQKYGLADVTTLATAYRVCEDVYNFVYGHLSEPQNADNLEYAMINGMFETLDPHTNLLPPYIFEEMMTGNGGFGGCGFVVGVREGNLTVISPMEGTPAWRAGIKAGDFVVRIDDESTENMPLQDAVDRMRGDVGTKVTLYIKRRGWVEARPFVITREKIEIKSVTSQALTKENIGYIKLKSFDQTTSQEVRTHLANLHKAMPKMKGLILDLRNNSGGLLQQSIEVAELFLKKGDPIVSVEGASKSDRETTNSRIDGTEVGYPIAILINEGTASASEIVSGALQYHDRAVVIGERSFGKGSVQVLKDNPDGSAIKITTAQYLTPGDISIQGVGIVPDIRFLPSFVDAKDGVSLLETHNVRREDDLELSLHSNKTTERTSAQSLRYLFQNSKENEERAKELGLTTYDLRSTENYSEDDETRFAVALLQQAKSANRAKILEASGKFFDKYRTDYLRNLLEAFKTAGIDWTDGNGGCAQFDWGMRYGDQTASQGGTIAFPADGEERQLVMWVKNTCEKGDLVQLSASLTSNDSAFDEREFAFGRIAPGEQREWPVKVKIPKAMATRDDLVDIAFYLGNDAIQQNTPSDIKGQFTASVNHLDGPRFAYTYWFDDVRHGDADGKLNRGESVDMYLWVRNVGAVASDKVHVKIANESGSGVLLQQGGATIESLEPGASELVMLRFDVSQDRPTKPTSRRIKQDRPFNPDEVVLRLTISDDVHDAQIVQPIVLPVAANADAATDRAETWKSLKAGAEIASRPSHGVTLAKVDTSSNVQTYPVGGGYAAVCWQYKDLHPCGFVAESELGPAAQDATANALSPVFGYEAPQIEFAERSHTETAASVTMTVTLRDNEALKDYEAFVWTHDGLQLKDEKLDYGLITGKEKQIVIDLPLKVGDNSLAVIARDRLDTESVAVFHINRK